ncbi:hemerythrin domain-containing protein [Rhodococcus sp. W8901]|uniref:hemerythrin domain-containing protein n=1 Tax=Rhodococcus sp. W8901 TaxID=2742603 RepID=UPI001582DD09|nr:hemerythrin domain-containing protein [Rhodococcus sp. W8901]QKT11520.1 hemerythrin domain-containing protein [Rhodococcus sp. W8901]
MNAGTDLEGPADTRVMGIVHSALRRDLARARDTLTSWPAPFDAQRIAIADHLLWMMKFLHHHHESEDNHLYPLVRLRNQKAYPLLDEMNADHRSIVPAMQRVEEVAGAYRDSAEAKDATVAAIDRLSELLLPHLEREERQMMPIVSATITEAEWREWDEEFNIKPLGPIELFDEGLFIVDDAEPDDRRAIVQLVPAIPRWLMLHVMIKRYRRAAFRRWRSAEFSPLKSPLGGRHEVTTSASPEAVWNVLADVTRVREWSHECHAARWLDGVSAASVGARFRGSSKAGFVRWSRTCTLTELDAPRQMVWVTDGGIYGDNTEWRFVLEPTDSGTRIVQSYRIINLPTWFDRTISLTVPAHHDRSDALQGDLVRLARLADREDASRIGPN